MNKMICSRRNSTNKCKAIFLLNFLTYFKPIATYSQFYDIISFYTEIKTVKIERRKYIKNKVSLRGIILQTRFDEHLKR